MGSGVLRKESEYDGRAVQKRRAAQIKVPQSAPVIVTVSVSKAPFHRKSAN